MLLSQFNRVLLYCLRLKQEVAMRSVFIALSIMIASGAFGEPATQPSPSPTPVVLVLPFASIGDASRMNWVGQAVQQNIMTELARVRSVKIVAGQLAAQNDADSIKKLAA